MSFPSDCRYTKDHEWVKVDGAVATIGITSFAQQELGELVFVELPAIGKKFAAKETICVVESTKAASDVYAPISGSVKEANKALSDSPSLVNSDPFGRGWMVKLEGISQDEIGQLMSASDYEQHVNAKH